MTKDSGKQAPGVFERQRFWILLLVCALQTVQIRAQVALADQMLFASDGFTLDEFGHSVSLFENRALVGAYLDDDQRGSAYVFERQSDGAWIETAKLTASDGSSEDWFGFSVSLFRDRALVGAWRNDDQGPESGSAYIFERQEDGSWNQVIKLLAIGGNHYDFFGYSVGLSADHAIVGARGHGGIFEPGAAYLYRRRTDGSWIYVQRLTPSETPDDPPFGRFGVSVSLSGNRAIVGASGDWHSGFASGAAHIFELQSQDSWIEVAKLTASDAEAGDRFGSSVSILGNRAIVGAFLDDVNSMENGSAYVFELQSDDSWVETIKLVASDGESLDHFGTSVALSYDIALVGSPLGNGLATDSGLAHIFERQADGNWLELHRLDAADGGLNNRFGVSVSLSGSRALVGAYWDNDLGPKSGSAYLFEDVIGTNIDSAADFSSVYRLWTPRPNPISSSAILPFEVPEAGTVQLVIYDLLGRQVAMIMNEHVSKGRHEAVVETRTLASGVYTVVLEADRVVHARQKMLLIR